MSTRVSPLAVYAKVGPPERLAAIACLSCSASLVLPWYRVSFSGSLVETGLGAFGFATAALLITVAAALLLLFEVGRGRRPPLPLHEGTLLAAAGAWSSLIIVYLMIDRPHLTVGGFRSGYGLAYGIFVALAGALLLGAAGLGIRRRELAASSAKPDSPRASGSGRLTQ